MAIVVVREPRVRLSQRRTGEREGLVPQAASETTQVRGDVRLLSLDPVRQARRLLSAVLRRPDAAPKGVT